MISDHNAANMPTTEELEALFVNNPLLARIESHLGRFNPIRVMRMERMEIRHSAILAWLLDPAESHGLEDKFLKAFLGEAFADRAGLVHRPPLMSREPISATP